MRILQVITDRNFRGAQVFASQLSDQLATMGHEVMLVSLYEIKNLRVKTQAGKAKNVELKGRKSTLSFFLVLRLRDVIRTFVPDVVQANGSDTLKYVVLATRVLLPRPAIIYRNISMAGAWIRPGLQRQIYGSLFRCVDHVASLTEITVNEFIKVYHFPAGKISAIPIGVDVPAQTDVGNARQNLSRRFNLPLEQPVLIHVGSFSKEKNQIGLLRIFSRIYETVPSYLVMVGDGPLLSEVKKAVAQMQLNNVVRLPGLRTDISDWLAGGSAFLLPSLVEGLPGVLLEAMAHGVPAVAYDVGAVREIVTDGRTGYVVARDDEYSFAARVVSLLRSSDRAKMSAMAVEKVRESYTMGLVAGAFEGIYKRWQTQ